MVKRGSLSCLADVQIRCDSPINAWFGEEDLAVFVNHGMEPFRNTLLLLMSCPVIVVFFPADSPNMLVSTNQIPLKICRSTRIVGPISREKLGNIYHVKSYVAKPHFIIILKSLNAF